MLEKLAKKALLKRSLKESLIKQAAPNPKPWYERAMDHPLGQAAMWGSMLIPATWGARLVGGGLMLARGGQAVRTGKRIYDTGSKLRSGANASQAAVTRGNQMRRAGAAQMRQGKNITDKANRVLGRGDGVLKIKKPSTYLPAAGNFLTAPAGKGVIGTLSAGSVGYYNYNALKDQYKNIKAGRKPWQGVPLKMPETNPNKMPTASGDAPHVTLRGNPPTNIAPVPKAPKAKAPKPPQPPKTYTPYKVKQTGTYQPYKPKPMTTY